ncbi:unnamed protein product [Arabidopsis thaliana]|nr:unnamed protein product [Arabidopsis thaliana]
MGRNLFLECAVLHPYRFVAIASAVCRFCLDLARLEIVSWSITEANTLSKALCVAKLTCKAPKRCIPTTLPLIEAAPLSLPCIEVRSTSIPRSEALSLVLPQCEDFTCFTDAAWNTFSGSCGMRWIFKTQHQRVIHQGSSSRLHTPSALAAEAFAFKSALTAALRMEFTSITVCLDSQVLISLFNTETTSNELQGILHDMTCLCRSHLYFKFCFISRLANMSADAIAKETLFSFDFPVV